MSERETSERERLDRLDRLCVSTLRALSIDAVQKANSGHPGTPMDAAPTLYCLWQHFLHYDPQDPVWPNRDRFVLSVGHASALLYSLLHLCRVRERTGRLAVTLDDLKTFRQAGSRCAGHPEYGWTVGVECTTGPLGQGVANSVGMAIAERWLGATYNQPGYQLYDHRVYALCGDGDMMEGIASEAASLAGHLRLSKLCWIYDDNRMSIEGPTRITFTERVAARFEAYGWQVIDVPDANDLALLDVAFEAFPHAGQRPTLIVVHSHIGYGAPHRQDTREAHGEPLGAEEARLAKQFYGCDPDRLFEVPAGVPEHFAAHFGQRGAAAHAAWETLFAGYRTRYPELAAQIDCMRKRGLPTGWDGEIPIFPADAKGMATRESSALVMNAIARRVPWFLGGAADLAPSTKTELKGPAFGDFQAPRAAGGEADQEIDDYSGRNFHFGVREHAMCAIANGMSLSWLRVFAASFFVFTDYCRAALRLAAMMEIPVIFVWTHDSISLGEDGPTHQPIEQLASLRAMPGMIVLRPADANEVAAAWRIALSSRGRPVSLVLTRQAVPTFDRTRYADARDLGRGAYVLADAPDHRPQVLLLASGSEVALCVAAYERLLAVGFAARVVSMPSWELFEAQDQAYRERVLPPAVSARVAVEEASSFGWARYVGAQGAVLGMHTFGLSAPTEVVMRHFGFDTEHVVRAAYAQIARARGENHEH